MTDKFDKPKEYTKVFVDGHSAGYNHAVAELYALRAENFKLRHLLIDAQAEIDEAIEFTGYAEDSEKEMEGYYKIAQRKVNALDANLNTAIKAIHYAKEQAEIANNWKVSDAMHIALEEITLETLKKGGK